MRKLFVGLLFLTGLAHADLISGSGGNAGTAYLNTPTSQNGNYNAACGDVVLASATPAGITIQLPTATSCNGKPVVVSKVDQSTFTVTIQVSGSDVMQGTGTLVLNAFTQTDAMMGSTIGQWIPWGQGFQLTPPSIEVGKNFGGTPSMTVSSNTIICPFYAAVPTSIKGFRYTGGSSAGATIVFAIYNQTATQVIFSTGPVAAGNNNQTVAVANGWNLPPGMYYGAVQMSNAVMSLTGGSDGNGSAELCSQMTGAAMGVPTTWTFGTAPARYYYFNILVAGGRTVE